MDDRERNDYRHALQMLVDITDAPGFDTVVNAFRKQYGEFNTSTLFFAMAKAKRVLAQYERT